jgi:protein required for attachment to host cells
MQVPHMALVVLADGEKCVLMRNVGQPLDPRLERVTDLDLELTNFSAGVRHQDPAGQRNGSTDLDELAHGAAIGEWLSTQALRGGIEQVVIAAEPKTLGQIRQHCHQELQNRIVGEVAKNLINSPPAAIAQALANA